MASETMTTEEFGRVPTHWSINSMHDKILAALRERDARGKLLAEIRAYCENQIGSGDIDQYCCEPVLQGVIDMIDGTQEKETDDG